MPLTRRDLLGASAGFTLAVAGQTGCATVPVRNVPFDLRAARSKELDALEKKVGGRLGVAMFDTGTKRGIGHRVNEPFSLCSTFKLPLAAIVLLEAAHGRFDLETFVPYAASDLVEPSPLTSLNLPKGGMTVVALAEATVTTSDNAAANLLLTLLGGPTGLTQKLRATGDALTRIDRREPEMNLVQPGDERDTTTPAAMAHTIGRILTTDRLPPAARERLIGWMIATKTGAKRVRAGFPSGWQSGDKTGTAVVPGMLSKYNDVAVVWPPKKSPVIVAAYYESPVISDEMRDADQAVLAAVGRIATEWIRDESRNGFAMTPKTP